MTSAEDPTSNFTHHFTHWKCFYPVQQVQLGIPNGISSPLGLQIWLQFVLECFQKHAKTQPKRTNPKWDLIILLKRCKSVIICLRIKQLQSWNPMSNCRVVPCQVIPTTATSISTKLVWHLEKWPKPLNSSIIAWSVSKIEMDIWSINMGPQKTPWNNWNTHPLHIFKKPPDYKKF